MPGVIATGCPAPLSDERVTNRDVEPIEVAICRPKLILEARPVGSLFSDEHEARRLQPRADLVSTAITRHAPRSWPSESRPIRRLELGAQTAPVDARFE
jgi:hypothetical protein